MHFDSEFEADTFPNYNTRTNATEFKWELPFPLGAAVICIQEIRRMKNYFNTNIIECQKSTPGRAEGPLSI